MIPHPSRRSRALLLHTPRWRHALVPLCAVLASCSGNVVIMGENGEEAEDDSFVPPPNSYCFENRTVVANLVVNNQAQLDALEGCTTVDGHLLVQPFFEPDLRPLHRLRVVRGELGLGGSYAFNASISAEWTTDEAALARDTVAAGFLHSLEGLERLETVGSLALTSLAAASLAPLAELRQLTDYGMLGIYDCNAITDLSPLGQLSGIQRLSVLSESLESLDGLQVRDHLVSLALNGQRLTNINALGSLRDVSDDLSINETALRDLAPLAQLWHAGGLDISNNSLLETLHGLEALELVDGYLVLANNGELHEATALDGLIMSEFLIVHNNQTLRRLAEFPNLRTNSIQIADNPLLEELPLLQGTFYAYSRNSPEEVLLVARGQVEISRNDSLQRFSVPEEWHGGVYVIIRENAALRELDLSDLETLDLLEITQNPALTSLRLGGLTSVDTLEVVGNPLLAPTTFDPLHTFERTMSGNAGDVAP
jgi:hypothetical protein